MRLHPSLLAGLLAAGMAVAGVPAKAANFSGINIWNQSNSCLDNATENDGKAQIWSCTGGYEQQWLYVHDSATDHYMILNRNTGLCLIAQPGSPGPIAVDVCDSNAGNAQWRVLDSENPLGPPSGAFVVWQNVSSGLCLLADSVRKGGAMLTGACDTTYDYERWHKQ